MYWLKKWLNDRSTGTRPEAVIVLTLVAGVIWILTRLLG